AADDFMNILLRQLVLGGHARLVFDKGNRVLVVFSLNQKGHRQHRERDVATHIQPYVVTAAEVRHAANDFEPEPVQQDERANRRTAGEQGFQQFVAEDDHIAPLRQVHFIKPPSLFEREITDLVELRLYAQNLAAGVGEFAD